MQPVLFNLRPLQGMMLLAVETVRTSSKITQFFVSKNLNNIYTDYTENLLRYGIDWKIYTITIRNLYIS